MAISLWGPGSRVRWFELEWPPIGGTVSEGLEGMALEEVGVSWGFEVSNVHVISS